MDFVYICAGHRNVCWQWDGVYVAFVFNGCCLCRKVKKNRHVKKLGAGKTDRDLGENKTMELKENYSLKAYNTFGIDVRCRYFAESQSEQELLELSVAYRSDQGKMLILGGGSNFLFTEDFPGIVFYPMMRGMEIVGEDDKRVLVRVGAGEVWDDFVAWTVERQWGGVENLSLIPGHVGASPVQNVGAYGMEAGDVIESVEAIDLENAGCVRIRGEECRFSYRDSIFKREWKNRFIITRVVFRLDKNPVLRLEYGSVRLELERMGRGASLQTVREAIIHIRKEKLPDVREYPNAGSFFKNPIVRRSTAESLLRKYPGMPVYPVDDESCKLSAGWMIESCGWKGRSLGKAGVYHKQALVLVNLGGAGGSDISLLADEVRKSVFHKFGIWIEPEVYVV